jgi:hypothetical protein
MVLAFKSTEGLGTDLKERAIDIVKGEEADERTEGSTVNGKGPIVDEIEFGLSGTVAVRGYVVANIFNTIC